MLYTVLCAHAGGVASPDHPLVFFCGLFMAPGRVPCPIDDLMRAYACSREHVSHALLNSVLPAIQQWREKASGISPGQLDSGLGRGSCLRLNIISPASTGEQDVTRQFEEALAGLGGKGGPDGCWFHLNGGNISGGIILDVDDEDYDDVFESMGFDGPMGEDEFN